MNKGLKLWATSGLLAFMALGLGYQRGWTALHKAMLAAVAALGVLQLLWPALQRRTFRRLENMSPDQREEFLARFDEKGRALIRTQLATGPTSDEWALAQLKQAGDDLSKPHHLEFQLRLPTPFAAEEATSCLRAAGFEATVQSDGQDGGWLCVATKTMVPDLAALQKIHMDLAGIAAPIGGRYEGWGMAAEREE
jgi:hypothetical protein